VWLTASVKMGVWLEFALGWTKKANPVNLLVQIRQLSLFSVKFLDFAAFSAVVCLILTESGTYVHSSRTITKSRGIVYVGSKSNQKKILP
jgi:hypothetical protein